MHFFQGFTNLGYDDDKYSDYSDPSQTRPPNGQSWNPEDSKDTYAKITEQLDQEKRFEVHFITYELFQFFDYAQMYHFMKD